MCGKIVMVLIGLCGEVNGVILDDGSIVCFVFDSLCMLLEFGVLFVVNGLGICNSVGIVIEVIDVGVSVDFL